MQNEWNQRIKSVTSACNISHSAMLSNANYHATWVKMQRKTTEIEKQLIRKWWERTFFLIFNFYFAEMKLHVFWLTKFTKRREKHVEKSNKIAKRKRLITLQAHWILPCSGTSSRLKPTCFLLHQPHAFGFIHQQFHQRFALVFNLIVKHSVFKRLLQLAYFTARAKVKHLHYLVTINARLQ